MANKFVCDRHLYFLLIPAVVQPMLYTYNMNFVPPFIGISLEALLLAGIIPSVVLLHSNIISVVVAVLVTRFCCTISSKKSSPSKGEEVYEQVEKPSTYEDIPMSTNPAYCPVIQN